MKDPVIGQHFALLSKVIGLVADSWVVTVRGKESATKPILETTLLLSSKEVNLSKYMKKHDNLN